MPLANTDLLRRSFLDSVYELTDLERAELALGLVCLRVSKLDARAEIVSGDAYVTDEVRYEYFGRPDLENAASLPSEFKSLAEASACADIITKLSASLLNAVDLYVDQYFPGDYSRNFGSEN